MRDEGELGVIDGSQTRFEVIVQRVVSPLDTGSIHGRATGLLRADRRVEVTFLLEQADFLALRERLLRRDGEVVFGVSPSDVTAIDTVRRDPLPRPARARRAASPR